MKFTSRADVAAPAEAMFDHIADLSFYVAEARRRGVIMRRTDVPEAPGRGAGPKSGLEVAAGASWEIDFRFRGRQRQMTLHTSRFLRPEQITYEGRSNSFDVTIGLQVIALSPSRSRFHLGFELRPRTLGARLLLQSARLGRARLESRLDERVRLFSAFVEERLLTA